jgi:hypothetical protein
MGASEARRGKAAPHHRTGASGVRLDVSGGVQRLVTMARPLRLGNGPFAYKAWRRDAHGDGSVVQFIRWMPRQRQRSITSRD